MNRRGWAFTLLLAWTAALATPGPVYRNCGEEWTLARPPKRILALNQHAADLLIALQAGPTLIGVAYVDDDPEALRTGRYRGVPLIAPRYPSSETLYALQPDLVVGGFASAFGRGLLDRRVLAEQGIGSYLLDAACERRAADPFAGVEADLRTLGGLLGHEEQAEAVLRLQARHLAEARRLGRFARRPRVFYLDSIEAGLNSEGAKGFVDRLLARAGADNLFGDLELGRTLVSREAVLARDPDVLLLADAVWSPARDKLAFLRADPALSTLRAVREACWLSLPFSQLVPGVASAQAAENLARDLARLERCGPTATDPPASRTVSAPHASAPGPVVRTIHGDDHAP